MASEEHPEDPLKKGVEVWNHNGGMARKPQAGLGGDV